MAQTTDTRERWNNYEEAARSGHESHEAEMWTALPAIVQAHDTQKNTISVIPSVKLKHVKVDGSSEWIQMPTFEEVPIQYAGGGGTSVTIPIAKGDEVLLVFSSRSIENWWSQGGIQNQISARMHDLSDGFAIPGFRSQPRKLKNVSATNWQLRTDEENPTHYIDFDPVNKKTKIVSPNPVRIEAPSLECTGEVVAKCDSDKIHLSTHTHAQPNDSHGDTETETNKPTNNS